jgi:hypothetical protein
MEVLIRWRCVCSASPKKQCRYCDNKGFMEQWIPYSLLRGYSGSHGGSSFCCRLPLNTVIRRLLAFR